jgi:hypothetical protein
MWWHTVTHGRGNRRMEWVASALHYLGTWCIQHYYRWCAHRGWIEAPSDLNGLVLFAKRQNLVSARVPSHFKRSLPSAFARSNEPEGSVCSRKCSTIWVTNSSRPMASISETTKEMHVGIFICQRASRCDHPTIRQHNTAQPRPLASCDIIRGYSYCSTSCFTSA